MLIYPQAGLIKTNVKQCSANLFKLGKKLHFYKYLTFLQISILPSFKEANQVRLQYTN